VEHIAALSVCPTAQNNNKTQGRRSPSRLLGNPRRAPMVKDQRCPWLMPRRTDRGMSCARCKSAMDELLRIAPIDHDQGLIAYECPRLWRMTWSTSWSEVMLWLLAAPNTLPTMSAALLAGSPVNSGTNKSTFLIAAASGCSSLGSTCYSRFFHLAIVVKWLSTTTGFEFGRRVLD